MQFSSRTLKIVRTFLGHGSVTKNIYIYHLSIYRKCKIAKLGNWNLLFYQQANANVHKKKPCYRHYEVVTSEVKNLHVQTQFIKPLHIFFVAVYYHLVVTGKIKRDLQPVILDRPYALWHYINIKGEKTRTPYLIRLTIKYHLNIFCISHRNTPNIKSNYRLQLSKDIKQ